MTKKMQPLDEVQWVDPTTLKANSYNPNKVAPPELRLLKISIMEDGWTQPIVARPDGEIIDGFHRWTLASKDAEVAALTGGLVPVVRVATAGPSHQMMSTIRHNRARGTHAVLRMADIVRELKDKERLPDAEIMRRLGMEDEEVERLYDTSGMRQRGRAAAFNAGWVPDDG